MESNQNQNQSNPNLETEVPESILDLQYGDASSSSAAQLYPQSPPDQFSSEIHQLNIQTVSQSQSSFLNAVYPDPSFQAFPIPQLNMYQQVPCPLYLNSNAQGNIQPNPYVQVDDMNAQVMYQSTPYYPYPDAINQVYTQPNLFGRLAGSNGPVYVQHPIWSIDELSLYDDDDIIEIKTRVEESKTSEESITASIQFLFNYLEVKEIEQEIPCILSLKGSSLDKDQLYATRPGLDLVCVVDVSGSMSGVKLDLVKKTLEFMLTLLKSEDRVSIIVFSDYSVRLIKLRANDEEGKIDLESTIRQIDISGSTNIISGLDRGLKVISERKIVNQVTSVLLLSDGCDDHSDTVLQRSKACADKYRHLINGSYSVHTFGYGSDHDAKVMQEISKENNGNFYYVEDPKDIPNAFSNCFGELVSVVADKIEVALTTQPCFLPFHLSKIYSENGDSHFPMPQVNSNDKKDAVFMLKFPGYTERLLNDEIIRPIKARISYSDKSGIEKIAECELEISVINEGRDEIEVNEDVMINYYRCKGADVLKIVSGLAESRQFEEAKETALKTANEFKECLVKNSLILKALIKDLEDAAYRVSTYESWEQGGRAQVNSVQACHYAQKAASNAMVYQTAAQQQYHGMAMDYFHS